MEEATFTGSDSQYLEEIKKLREIIVENQGIITAKDNFINDQKEQIAQYQNELRTIKSQMEKEKEVEVQKLMHQNKLISQSFQSLSTQFQSAQENVRQLTLKLKDFEKTGGRNMRNNNDTPAVSIETQDEIKQLKIQLESYRKKIESLKLENEKQKTEYETRIEENAVELARKIQALKYEVEARDKQISYLQQNSDSEDESEDSESEGNGSSLKNSNNSLLKAQIQDQNAKLVSLNSLIENLKAEIVTKDKNISALKSEIENHNGKSRQLIPQNIPNFLSEINSLEKLNSELSATVQMLRDKVKQLEQELSISNERIRYYHDDLSAKNATIMQLNRKIKDQLLNAKLPPQKSSNAASIISELRKEISKVQISNEALITRCASLSDEVYFYYFFFN
jgi:predicted RNase H-like nuclease (RuvC/YqgF family)